MTPLDDLVRLSGRGFLDETDGRAFLAETGPRVLVFSGVEKRRPEAQDVAVIIREFHRLYQGAFEFAVLSGHAEDRLKSGLGVVVLPSAVLLGAGPPRVVPRVQDWRVYAQAFHESFGPARRAAAE